MRLKVIKKRARALQAKARRSIESRLRRLIGDSPEAVSERKRLLTKLREAEELYRKSWQEARELKERLGESEKIWSARISSEIGQAKKARVAWYEEQIAFLRQELAVAQRASEKERQERIRLENADTLPPA